MDSPIFDLNFTIGLFLKLYYDFKHYFDHLEPQNGKGISISLKSAICIYNA